MESVKAKEELQEESKEQLQNTITEREKLYDLDRNPRFCGIIGFEKHETTKDFPLELLQVYKCPWPKIRVGKEYDGGYVMVERETGYDYLIGCGIFDDDSFERDFIDKYKVNCIEFDGICFKDIPDHSNITFVRKFVSDKNTEHETDLHSIIEDYDNIFLKMDIEASEYIWLHTLSEEQLNKFAQIVIEFHYPFTPYRWEAIRKLNKTHYLCHFHGNNYRGNETIQGVEVPEVFECAYVRKKDFENPFPFSDDPIPGELDMPNNPRKKDVELAGFPYTF